jgi:outer membrane protein assembly factor BamB
MKMYNRFSENKNDQTFFQMNKLLPLLLFLFLSFAAQAQQSWLQIYGEGDKFFRTNDVEQYNDGGFILVGRMQFLSLEGHIVRTDAAGEEIWSFTLSDFYTIYGAHVLDNGNILLCGSGSDMNQARAILIDSDGNTLWEYSASFSNSRYVDAVQLDNGQIVLAGPQLGQGEVNRFTTLDTNGNFVAEESIPNGPYFFRALKDIDQKNGELLLAESGLLPNGKEETLISRYDQNYAQLWEYSYVQDSLNEVLDIQLAANGDILFSGRSENAFSGEYKLLVGRIDDQGNEKWVKPLPSGGVAISILETQNGDLVITGFIAGQTMIARMDADGNLLWQETLDWLTGGEFSLGVDVFEQPDGGLVIGGDLEKEDLLDRMYLLKLNGQGNFFSSAISGNIYDDVDENCSFTAGIDSLHPGQVMIEVEGWIFPLYADVAPDGSYLVPVNPGTYQVTAHPVAAHTGACSDEYTVEVPNPGDMVEQDFLFPFYDCPTMTVDVGIPFLRRCVDNKYYVKYCNEGGAVAQDASVEITLDPWLSYVSSSIPFASQSGQTYTFELGNVQPGHCENFTITAYLDCDTTFVGQTHCVEAHIFPDTSCVPVDPLWSGADIEVSSHCEGDSVIFIIQNVGVGNMQEAAQYIVVEDQLMLMMMPGSFQLDSGDSLVITLPANGATWYLAAEEAPYYPGLGFPATAIEGCDADGDGDFSTGFFNQFALGDDDPWLDIDCTESIAAYDPNDKQGFPYGYGSQHFIDEDTELEYRIRFQNTGNDTAFLVYIRDTLSEFLDPTSIQPGASSHPYEFELFGSGIIQFTFNDIMLPDSNVNESASHGFVDFRIRQQPGNPVGTEIFNQAAIYFDFNPPIFTNQTVHRIGEDFIEMETVSIHKAETAPDALRLYPNPLRDQATFEWFGAALPQARFEIYDPAGRLLRSQSVSGRQWTIARGELQPGFYFFVLSDETGRLASGKLVVRR